MSNEGEESVGAHETTLKPWGRVALGTGGGLAKGLATARRPSRKGGGKEGGGGGGGKIRRPKEKKLR